MFILGCTWLKNVRKMRCDSCTRADYFLKKMQLKFQFYNSTIGSLEIHPNKGSVAISDTLIIAKSVKNSQINPIL